MPQGPQKPLKVGEIPAGWRPRCWAERLRYLADVCEATDRKRADQLREWARLVERQIPPRVALSEESRLAIEAHTALDAAGPRGK